MADEKRLVAYDPNVYEALLLAWFFKLRESGDLNKVFYTDLHNLTSFLSFFANSVKLGLAFDEKGIYFAAWVRPILDAGEFSLWIREDKRQSPSSLKCLYEAYDKCFETFSTLIGISKQNDLKAIHEKFGYKFYGEIPRMWAGKPVQVYYLTKEAYQNGINSRRNRR